MDRSRLPRTEEASGVEVVSGYAIALWIIAVYLAIIVGSVNLVRVIL